MKKWKWVCFVLLPYLSICFGMIGMMVFAPRLAPYFADTTGWTVEESLKGLTGEGLGIALMLFFLMGAIPVIASACISIGEGYWKKNLKEPKPRVVKKLKEKIEFIEVRSERIIEQMSALVDVVCTKASEAELNKLNRLVEKLKAEILTEVPLHPGDHRGGSGSV